MSKYCNEQQCWRQKILMFLLFIQICVPKRKCLNELWTDSDKHLKTVIFCSFVFFIYMDFIGTGQTGVMLLDSLILKQVSFINFWHSLISSKQIMASLKEIQITLQ